MMPPLFMRIAWMLLAMVPLPKGEPSSFPVGSFTAQWGALQQEMTFLPDGRYRSAEYGNGFWSIDNEGWILFTERENTTHYAMWLDDKTGTGSGWSHCQESGELRSEVKVRLTLRECLPMPREVKQ